VHIYLKIYCRSSLHHLYVVLSPRDEKRRGAQILCFFNNTTIATVPGGGGGRAQKLGPGWGGVSFF